MNQIMIGKFITYKRKEKNLTQGQLAEKIGVSNKTISKWECGKCMPDYSIIEVLCKELDISIAELIDGKESEQSNKREYDEKQILDMLSKIQNLEGQKNNLFGIILVVMGMAFLALSQTTGGTNFRDFLSGLMLGLSVGEMLIGLYIISKSILKQ